MKKFILLAAMALMFCLPLVACNDDDDGQTYQPPVVTNPETPAPAPAPDYSPEQTAKCREQGKDSGCTLDPAPAGEGH